MHMVVEPSGEAGEPSGGHILKKRTILPALATMHCQQPLSYGRGLEISYPIFASVWGALICTNSPLLRIHSVIAMSCAEDSIS